MIIRTITEYDAERLYQMLCQLDEETEYMMYEPGERQRRRKGSGQLREQLVKASSVDYILVAENDDAEFVGFLWAERGKLNRILHTAYIVIGIRKAYCRRGIGTEFFGKLDKWAKSNGIVRLELTVEIENTSAKSLYERNGFKVEGVRYKSMKVNGELVDEYYMGKIIG